MNGSTLKKAAIVAVCVAGFVWVGGTVVIFHAMHQPPEQFGHVMSRIPGELPFMIFPFETLWMRARAGTLNVGDPAPDFSLTRLDKSGQVQLSSFSAQSRPVILIFGSYT